MAFISETNNVVAEWTVHEKGSSVAGTRFMKAEDGSYHRVDITRDGRSSGPEEIKTDSVEITLTNFGLTLDLRPRS